MDNHQNEQALSFLFLLLFYTCIKTKKWQHFCPSHFQASVFSYTNSLCTLVPTKSLDLSRLLELQLWVKKIKILSVRLQIRSVVLWLHVLSCAWSCRFCACLFSSATPTWHICQELHCRLFWTLRRSWKSILLWVHVSFFSLFSDRLYSIYMYITWRSVYVWFMLFSLPSSRAASSFRTMPWYVKDESKTSNL